MTDLPRRSYPLVMPPPGGFEDAVRRGRRVRRRRAGGGTGAALMLVGALVYSTLDGPGSTTGLEPAGRLPQAPRHDLVAPPSTSESPSPTAKPTDTRPTNASPVASPRPGEVAPTAAPTIVPPQSPSPSGPPTRSSDNPRRRYSVRQPINESGPATASYYITCEDPIEGARWCARARADVVQETGGTRYHLSYTLCRATEFGPGTVTFDRKQEANFSATHVDTEDTVWTWSAGQPVEPPEGGPTTIDGGDCVTWTTVWNGLDDFGYMPPDETYLLRARSTGKSDVTLPLATVEFEHE